MDQPLAIDLFCGLGGWTEGLLAEGYFVAGFDIEQHEYWVPDTTDSDDGRKGTKPVEKRGWTRGCAVSLGLEGSGRLPSTKLLKYPGHLVIQDVLTLHGSQFKDAALIVASPPCQKYSYMAMPWSRAKAQAAEIRADETGQKLADLNRLFEACFRIQREAIEAAGHHIPLIVENVRGAQPWVGGATFNYGSFYLWGDVPVLMPRPYKAQKVPGFRFDGSGRSFQSASVEAVKVPSQSGGRTDIGNGARFTSRDCGVEGLKPPARVSANPPAEGRKGAGAEWFDQNTSSLPSNSPRRKAASAMIAKIPLPLSRHIARTFRPS